MTPGSFDQESIQAAKLLNRRAVLLIGKNAPPKNLSESIIAVNYRHTLKFFLLCIKAVLAQRLRHYVCCEERL